MTEKKIILDCRNCFAPCCRIKHCPHLQPDSSCPIYEDRPVICRADTMYEMFYKDTMTREQFTQFMSEACENMRKTYLQKPF